MHPNICLACCNVNHFVAFVPVQLIHSSFTAHKLWTAECKNNWMQFPACEEQMTDEDFPFGRRRRSSCVFPIFHSTQLCRLCAMHIFGWCQRKQTRHECQTQTITAIRTTKMTVQEYFSVPTWLEVVHIHPCQLWNLKYHQLIMYENCTRGHQNTFHICAHHPIPFPFACSWRYLAWIIQIFCC